MVAVARAEEREIRAAQATLDAKAATDRAAMLQSQLEAAQDSLLRSQVAQTSRQVHRVT